MQRLVGVDVAYAGDRLLVEQHGLQGRAPPPQLSIELLGREVGIDQLRAEARHLPGREQRFLGADEQAAKAPGVAIAQLATVIEEEHGVGVLREWNDLVDQPQLARHPQVHHQ